MVEIGSVRGAKRTFAPWQAASLFLFLLASEAALIIWTEKYLVALIALATLGYVVSIGYKIHLTILSLREPSLVRVSEKEVNWPRGWPKYTVAVPLFREAGVLPELVQSLIALDYPKDRLQVILLLEGDDSEAIRAAKGLHLPSWFELVVLPSHRPRTKPFAVNEALRRATGEFFVIYDAEDRPEKDQLKKAVVGFGKVGLEVVCLQSKLEYHNPTTNLLTRWFAAEYATWFNLTLPGISYCGKPVPLGGTSNHFPTAFLRSVGGWDPYNVTEDCDLGVRIARMRKKTKILDSVTWEEANCQVGNWVRQRSRWTKGFMQTYLVHMRNPVRLLRDLGLANFLGFQVLVGGTPFCLLVNPFFWLVSVAWVLTQASLIEALFPGGVYYLGMISMVFGNFIFIYLALTGAMFREQYSSVKYMLAIYFYWILMSVGAYKALWQLFARPHYWEKTEHGLLKRKREVVTVRISRFTRVGLVVGGLLATVLAACVVGEGVRMTGEARSILSPTAVAALATPSATVSVAVGADERTVSTAGAVAAQASPEPTAALPSSFPVSTATATTAARLPPDLGAFQRGVHLTLWSGETPSESRLAEIKERLHVSSVSVVVPIWMETQDGPVSRGRTAVSDRRLGSLLDSLHRQGLQVLVRPLLQIRDTRWWRGNIQPHDRWAWQRSYSSVLVDLARVAEEHNAERFCIGVEMNSTQEDRELWEAIVGDVRAVYSGRVVYAANWDGYWAVPFWDLVDEMHIDAFFPLNVGDDATVEQLVAAWQPYVEKVLERQAQTGKPLVLGELGLMPQAGRWRTPWVCEIDEPLDPDAQWKYYLAARIAWSEKVAGVYIWAVDIDSGEDGLVGTFSPIGKPVENLVREWFTERQ